MSLLSKSLYVAFLGLLITTSVAWGLDDTSAQRYDTYYKIEEPTPILTPHSLLGWSQLLPLEVASSNIADLMRWVFNRITWPDPSVSYNRREHFGGWLRGKGERSCINTRAAILIRDSEIPVEMNASGCTVKSGRWRDPYTGDIFTDASDIQIDHMVPLKNAYISGASNWNGQQRCAYSNFMSNRFHLIAVSGRENMRKGDRTPAQWVPPNQGYLCTYLKDWLSIKLIWGLIMGPQESEAIQQAFVNNHCDPGDFKLTYNELQDQRQDIQKALDECQ